MRKWIIGLLVLLAVAGTLFVIIPQGEDAAQKLDLATASKAKQVARETPAGATLPLSLENTKIGFACAKTLAGKTLTMRGGWSEAFDSRLTGQLLRDPNSYDLQHVELQIDVASLWSEHEQLTEALLTQGFFQAQAHPQATFVSTNIEPFDSGAATHRIEGNFQLNGIEKSISFPASIESDESGVRLEAEFSLQRHDFDVRFAETASYGLLTDEDISDLVAVTVTIDLDPTASLQQAAPAEFAATETSPEKVMEVAELPSSFTETIPATQVNFNMVLVPGDADRGIASFYLGQKEVTWEEFMPWVDGRDLADQQSMGELRAMKLRPSPPYGTVDRGFGMEGRPALGMSRLSAELYCKWLSEQTGNTYRLPREAEWEWAYLAGGGSLDTPLTEALAEVQAVYADNSWDDLIGDWATMPVGSMQANKLDICDMAGNVAEWVIDTGDERVIRGGHFDSDLADLAVGRLVETPDWNRDYPNEPKSIWWFVNAPWVGFRVVCEASPAVAD